MTLSAMAGGSGSAANVNSVVVWNRTDRCGDRVERLLAIRCQHAIPSDKYACDAAG